MVNKSSSKSRENLVMGRFRQVLIFCGRGQPQLALSILKAFIMTGLSFVSEFFWKGSKNRQNKNSNLWL